jgi:hypothetical protein
MAMKDFDYKDFLLRKGERVGLWVAVGLTALLVVAGTMAAMSSINPRETARRIEGKATEIQRQVATADRPVPPIDPKIGSQKVNLASVGPREYAADTELTGNTGLEDPKRRNPQIMAPTEFHAVAARVPVESLVFSGQGKAEVKLGILKEGKEAKDQKKPPRRRKGQLELLLRLQRMGGGEGAGLGMMPPGARGAMPPGARGGMPPGGMGMMPRGGMGMMPPGGMGMMPPGMAGFGPEGGSAKPEMKLEYEEVKNVTDSSHLAIQVLPTHMAVVSASFPYKSQLDSFKKALKLRSVDDLFNDPNLLPQFTGFDVMRRTLRPDGKVAEDWAPLDLRGDEFRYVFSRSTGPEPEDSKLRPVILSRKLVLPRPKLKRPEDDDARDGKESKEADQRFKYPDVNLASITKTLEEAAKVGKSATAAAESALQRRISGSGDFYEQPDESEAPAGAEGRGRGAVPPGPGARGDMVEKQKQMMMDVMRKRGAGVPPGPTTPTTRQEGAPAVEQEFVPDNILVRFLDVTVRPGFTYEYKVRIKTRNPNYGKKDLVAYPFLATLKELEGPLAPEKGVAVSVPHDSAYYAVDQPDESIKKRYAYIDRDMTFFQVHEWLAAVRLKPGVPESARWVGDWAIGDLGVHRGEYIGREDFVEVPMWIETLEDYSIPTDRATIKEKGLPRGTKGIRVNFQTGALLVDFDKPPDKLKSSTGRAVHEEKPDTESLILSPDGKLLARNSNTDNEDPERRERHESWKKWVKKIRDSMEEKKDSGGTKPKETGIFNPNS